MEGGRVIGRPDGVALRNRFGDAWASATAPDGSGCGRTLHGGFPDILLAPDRNTGYVFLCICRMWVAAPVLDER